MKPRAFIILAIVVIIGLILGLLYTTRLWHAVFRLGSTVTVVNLSDSSLQQVIVDVDYKKHSIPLIAEGTSSTVVVSPPDSRDVHVSFNCNDIRRTINCGAIGDKGEQRTVKVLKNGENVIILFGTANKDAAPEPTTIVSEDE